MVNVYLGLERSSVNDGTFYIGQILVMFKSLTKLFVTLED